MIAAALGSGMAGTQSSTGAAGDGGSRGGVLTVESAGRLTQGLPPLEKVTATTAASRRLTSNEVFDLYSEYRAGNPDSTVITKWCKCEMLNIDIKALPLTPLPIIKETT